MLPCQAWYMPGYYDLGHWSKEGLKLQAGLGCCFKEENHTKQNGAKTKKKQIHLSTGEMKDQCIVSKI